MRRAPRIEKPQKGIFLCLCDEHGCITQVASPLFCLLASGEGTTVCLEIPLQSPAEAEHGKEDCGSCIATRNPLNMSKWKFCARARSMSPQ